MGKEINIAAILRDKPENVKLWSSAFGDCVCREVGDSFISIVSSVGLNSHTLDRNGKYYQNGECIIFPSKEMRDWSKFAWKKGDVLVCKSVSPHIYTLFDHFTNDDYTEFYGRFHYLHEYRENSGNTSGKTAIFEKISDEIATRVISSMERHFGGKLNQSTLEIEKSEFKDGDIFTLDDNETYIKTIGIFKGYNNDGRIKVYAAYNMNRGIDHINVATYDRTIHPATDSEKQQLFSALEKYGKRWNADTKTLEDLPKKCEFKPFDKVVVRFFGNTWCADFFSNYDNKDEEVPYTCIGGSFSECLPYNDKTAHLLGTTEDWEGGEG